MALWLKPAKHGIVFRHGRQAQMEYADFLHHEGNSRLNQIERAELETGLTGEFSWRMS